MKCFKKDNIKPMEYKKKEIHKKLKYILFIPLFISKLLFYIKYIISCLIHS